MNKTELAVVLTFISVAGWALESSVNVSHVGGSAATVNGDGGLNVHTTNGGSGGTASSFSQAFPSAGTAAGGIGINGNMQTFALDASSAIKVNVIAGGAGGGAAQFTGPTGALTTPGYNGVPVSSFPVNVMIGGAQITNTNPVPVNLQGVVGASVTFPSPQPVVVGNVTSTQSVIVTNVTSTQSVIVTNVTSTASVNGTGLFTVTPSTGVYTVVTATAVPVSLGQNAYGNNGAAFPQGASAPLMTLSTSGLQGVWSGPDYTFASYSASSGVYTVANTTGDISQMCGNQINVTLVTGLRIAFTQTTAGIIPVTIAKRTAQDAGLYFSTITATAEDANYPPSQSTATFFNNGITNAALAGYVDQGQVGAMAAATATPNDIYISPANWRMKPIVLRSHDQCVAVNLQSTSFTGGKATITWEWMEVKSP